MLDDPEFVAILLFLVLAVVNFVLYVLVDRGDDRAHDDWGRRMAANYALGGTISAMAVSPSFAYDPGGWLGVFYLCSAAVVGAVFVWFIFEVAAMRVLWPLMFPLDSEQ